jgi:thymidylate synthase (FAD)
MNKIGVGLLNSGGIPDLGRTMTVMAARVTQQGHKIKSMADVSKLSSEASDELIAKLAGLPHPTLQKFYDPTFIFVGVSRRFMAQITRHQDIKFMCSSFRYGDHSEVADFVTPIEVMRHPALQESFNDSCAMAMEYYKELAPDIGRDAAGYLLPNATRCTILAHASMFQWRHMINQRTCKRCGQEMRYVMLRAWELLHAADPVMFAPNITGPDCMQHGCREGTMCCGAPDQPLTPGELLNRDFPELMIEEESEYDVRKV